VLCVGVAVLDEIFRVARFPAPDVKTRASEFMAITGGNAANAAITIARLGGRVIFAGPFGGPAGADMIGDRILAGLAREGIDVSLCRRIDGLTSSISAISIDARGERAIVNYRDERLAAARPHDPAALVAGADLVLADNRFPEFVLEVCEAARARGLRIVLDADQPTRHTHDLLRLCSHVVFSHEGLTATAGKDDLAEGLREVRAHTPSFLGVTNGAHGMLWLEDDAVRRMDAFRVDAVDTLGAGDVFHGAFALALAEGRDEAAAMRFASAAAALKCTRFGGITGAPSRAEVDALLS
jgi:sugar/nucleoside kinase (ribokinase family)